MKKIALPPQKKYKSKYVYMICTILVNIDTCERPIPNHLDTDVFFDSYKEAVHNMYNVFKFYNEKYNYDYCTNSYDPKVTIYMTIKGYTTFI